MTTKLIKVLREDPETKRTVIKALALRYNHIIVAGPSANSLPRFDSLTLQDSLSASFVGQKEGRRLSMVAGCEPNIGDTGFLGHENNEGSDEEDVSELLKQINLEETGLKTRPGQLERAIKEWAIWLEKDQLKEKCKEYSAPVYKHNPLTSTIRLSARRSQLQTQFDPI